MSYGWKLTPGVLGLAFVPVAVGISSNNNNKPADPAETQRRMIETVGFALLAAHVTKSWFPIVLPIGYLAFDQLWSNYYSQPSSLGV